MFLSLFILSFLSPEKEKKEKERREGGIAKQEGTKKLQREGKTVGKENFEFEEEKKKKKNVMREERETER